ncbi:MAG: hypothetical protein ACI9SC_001437 [Gammaproteobacteria bacterium]
MDKTQRPALETTIEGQWGKADWFAAYRLLEASFEDDLKVLSPVDIFADEGD